MASIRFALVSLSLAALSLASGCVVKTTDHDRYAEGYREGYYDREHNRWWHDHQWHECVEHDEHCHD